MFALLWWSGTEPAIFFEFLPEFWLPSVTVSYSATVLLNIYMCGTVGGARDTVINKIDRVPTLKELLIARETRKKKSTTSNKKTLAHCVHAVRANRLVN